MTVAQKKWVLAFAMVDFSNRIAFGIFGTLMGPVQPYLAKSIGVDIQTISLLWTFGGISWLLGTVLSALTFKQHFRSSSSKLAFFTVTSMVMAAASFNFPKAETFTELVLISSARNFAAAAWETAGAGILVYTMGPIKSRVLVMCHHFFAGLGFVIGPFLLQHFLPSNSNSSDNTPNNNDEICQRKTEISENISNLGAHEMDMLSKPFALVSLWHLVCCFGYLALAFLPYAMPVHLDLPLQTKSKSKSGKWDLVLMITLVAFYMSSCGSERLFQSSEFLFGLCGPLKLSAAEAVVTDQTYNGGFVMGRFVAMFLVDRVSPRHLLRYSTFGCLASSLLMALRGGDSAEVLYLSAGAFGFCISAQFGAAYSWAAEHMDVVGSRAALFHIGCTLGGSVMPAAAAFLFAHYNPMSVWYLNLFCALMQVVLFAALGCLFREDAANRGGNYKRLPIKEDSQ